MMRPTRSLRLPKIWSDAWVTYLDHIAQIEISHTASNQKRGRYHNLISLRGMDEDRQAPPLSKRPRALVEMQRQSRQDMVTVFIPRSERRRLTDQLNPSLRGYLEWLSTNWTEYFTEEHEPPTSSSSCKWSSTSWWSPQEWSSTWQGWHQHS